MSTQTEKAYRHFHEQLEELTQRLLDMSRHVETAIDLAVDSLLEHDPEQARMVIAGDRALDVLELEIEHIAVSLLALQQPMARDLRFVIGAIKLSSDLERVGDHAVNIAEAALRLDDDGTYIAPQPAISAIAADARLMLVDAIDAFVRSDASLGRAVCRRDDAVDERHDAIFRNIEQQMRDDPSTISASLQLLLVIRNIERVADLATNIAEDAVYLAEGRTIKHHANP
ncbi:MAG TPA: phosphate signaling complex protein PhoU [Gemmatimonadaceae bacterium]|jgi:phosphate transport system protein|nr:phosphate signaling complex protein PhoU [Gemmatimonadaceae bacterium]